MCIRDSNNGVGAGTYAMVKQGKLTVSANYNYNYNNSPRSYSDSYRENYEPDKELSLIHIFCASADRLYSREVNEQTFYYTNMSPQRNKFNTRCV